MSFQGAGYRRMDKSADISAQTTDFPNQAGGKKSMLIGSHQKQGLNLRIHAAIDGGQLKFMLKIRNGAQPAQNQMGFSSCKRWINNPEKARTRTPGMPVRVSVARATLSVRGNMGFLGVSEAMATTTSSKSWAARRTRSSCPWVIGSKVPGYIIRLG